MIDLFFQSEGELWRKNKTPSGSAPPMNPEALAFLKMIMCCPFIEAYGQTEDSAAVIFGRAYDTQY
jgi:long-subunit acyl-CoA synthetase (AMP-forming)